MSRHSAVKSRVELFNNFGQIRIGQGVIVEEDRNLIRNVSQRDSVNEVLKLN
ncbi:MAG TPA: hypothetical protein PLY87_05975 [Planctomycetaceae bacterium]|nr:hypothetical protein [Planctomycetaceae bacterium]